MAGAPAPGAGPARLHARQPRQASAVTRSGTPVTDAQLCTHISPGRRDRLLASSPFCTHSGSTKLPQEAQETSVLTLCANLNAFAAGCHGILLSACPARLALPELALCSGQWSLLKRLQSRQHSQRPAMERPQQRARHPPSQPKTCPWARRSRAKWCATLAFLEGELQCSAWPARDRTGVQTARACGSPAAKCTEAISASRGRLQPR